MTESNRRHPTSQIGTLPTELITQIVVPQVGLEPTRTRHWLLRPAWLPLHHRGNKYAMLDKEINLIERLLVAQAKQYPTTTEQLLYDRGFLLGLLASLAFHDSLVKHEIIQKLKKHKNNWCHELDSNQPHTDFQSAALPDELPRQNDWYLDTVSNRGPSPCKGDALPLSYPGKLWSR